MKEEIELDGILDAMNELQRMVNERLDNMIKEMSEAKNASLLKREWRCLAKIDIS
jgi:hypothetical protein